MLRMLKPAPSKRELYKYKFKGFILELVKQTPNDIKIGTAINKNPYVTVNS